MKRRFCFWIVTLALGTWLLGCSAQGNDTAKEEKNGGRPPVAVEVVSITSADLTDEIEVVGSLTPKFEAAVKSEYAGLVTEVHVTEWVRVKKGDPLVKLDTREAVVALQKAQAAVELAKANLLQAEVAKNRTDREYDRMVALKEAGLVPQQNLDDARTEREAAMARIAASKAQLKVANEDVHHEETRVAKAVIRSPIDGVIASRDVNLGDLVGEMGSPKIMFRIVDTRLLNLTVMVPSGKIGSLALGQPLIFSTEAIPGKTFTGKIMFINPVVNEADRSLKVIAEVKNTSEELKGGLFVKGRIVTGQRQGVLQIPRMALLTWDVDGKKGDIFVMEGEMARRRSIQIGSVSGDLVEVSAGVSPGDRIITRGGFNLKQGDRVKVAQDNN